MFFAVENVIPKDYQDFLENLFFNPSVHFPWFMNPQSLGDLKESNFTDKNSVDCPYFYHSFIINGKDNSDNLKYVLPIAKYLGEKTKVKTDSILNIRANMTYPDPKCREHNYKPPHVDNKESNSITAIYYVNECDGDTLFFTESKTGLRISGRMKPKKGTIVYFDTSQIHCSVPPKVSPLRCVLNFNFLQE